jgi:signal transduction histidine kinase
MATAPSSGADPAADDRYGPTELRLKYKEQFEFLLDCHLLTDRQGVILEANFAAVTLLDCRKEFLIGKPLGLFVADEFRNTFYQHLIRITLGGRTAAFESRVGRSVPRRDVLVLPFPSDDNHHVRWILRDITPVKRFDRDRTELLGRLVTAQEDERRRISRELHDSIGQLLAGLTLAVKAARSADLPARVHGVLDDVQRISDELSRTAHDFAVRLRPTALDDLGLVPALEQFLSRLAARAEFEVDFHAQGFDGRRLPAEVETVLYRVAQEAVTNATRHAQPKRVSVLLTRTGSDVTLTIEDDGVGFDPGLIASPEPDRPRLGLAGMRERVGLVGGTLQIESSAGRGTTVLARVPLTRAGEG